MNRQGIHQGYYWTIAYNGMGFLCGYVLLRVDHPMYHNNIEEIIEVHGGITYDSPDPPHSFVQPRIPVVGRWIGFDCAHLGDAPDPKFGAPLYRIADPNATFKDDKYVFREIEKMIRQLGHLKSDKLPIEYQPYDIIELPL